MICRVGQSHSRNSHWWTNHYDRRTGQGWLHWDGEWTNPHPLVPWVRVKLYKLSIEISCLSLFKTVCCWYCTSCLKLIKAVCYWYYCHYSFKGMCVGRFPVKWYQCQKDYSSSACNPWQHWHPRSVYIPNACESLTYINHHQPKDTDLLCTAETIHLGLSLGLLALDENRSIEFKIWPITHLLMYLSYCGCRTSISVVFADFLRDDSSLLNMLSNHHRQRLFINKLSSCCKPKL